jgi:hypothetical protein
MNRVSQFQRDSFQIVKIIIIEITKMPHMYFFLKGPCQSISPRASLLALPPLCGRLWHIWWRRGMRASFWLGDLNGDDHSENLYVDRKI